MNKYIKTNIYLYLYIYMCNNWCIVGICSPRFSGRQTATGPADEFQKGTFTKVSRKKTSTHTTRVHKMCLSIDKPWNRVKHIASKRHPYIGHKGINIGHRGIDIYFIAFPRAKYLEIHGPWDAAFWSWHQRLKWHCNVHLHTQVSTAGPSLEDHDLWR